MKRKSTALSRRYQAALRNHVNQKSGASLEAAHGLGRDAMTLGLETLDVARIHEHAMITVVSSYSPDAKDGIFGARELFLPKPSHRSRRLIAPRGKPTPT